MIEWGENITSEMREILKEEIPGALKGVTKDAVKEVASNKKPWNESFSKGTFTYYNLLMRE